MASTNQTTDTARRASGKKAAREENGRVRIILAMSAFVIAYVVIAGRLVALGMAEERPNRGRRPSGHRRPQRRDPRD